MSLKSRQQERLVCASLMSRARDSAGTRSGSATSPARRARKALGRWRVEDGDAVLTGIAGSENQAELLQDAVRQIPGVVEVRSEISFPAGK